MAQEEPHYLVMHQTGAAYAVPRYELLSIEREAIDRDGYFENKNPSDYWLVLPIYEATQRHNLPADKCPACHDTGRDANGEPCSHSAEQVGL